MKKLIVFLIAASFALFIYLMIAGSGGGYNTAGVRYISSKSYAVSGNECSLCFENTTQKPLKFCVYGVYNGERIAGLDENKKLKTVTIQPNERRGFVFVFDKKPPILPDDVVIVGEYLTY